MKYFFDTEFIEKPNTIELISIGIISEDGDEYYAISSEFDPKNADVWVMENVIDKLEDDVKRKPVSTIKKEILEFVKNTKEDRPEFYAYYGSYDWVVFCWIFGKMIELPKGFPMLPVDLKQMLNDIAKSNLNYKYTTKQLEKEIERIKKLDDYPVQDEDTEHNALDDGKWNLELFKFLEKLLKEK